MRVWDLVHRSNDSKPPVASIKPAPAPTTPSRPKPPQEVERPVTFSAETARVTEATQDDPLTFTLKGHTEATTSLAISPDGKWLASVSSDGLVVWDVADRKPRFTLRSHGQYAISSVAISPDGKHLAAGVEKVVKVWDAATGAELQSLAGNTVREDQLDEMQKPGVIPSFFNMHTYYWGDWHRDETLGRERAFRIEPSASAVKRKMVWTSHHDAPVALPDTESRLRKLDLSRQRPVDDHRQHDLSDGQPV